MRAARLESQLIIEKKSSLFAPTKLTVVHFVGGPKRPYYSFSPVFLANGMVREARDSGENLQEHVKMTHRYFYAD